MKTRWNKIRIQQDLGLLGRRGDEYNIMQDIESQELANLYGNHYLNYY